MRNVLLLLDVAWEYSRGVLAGVSEYAWKMGPWRVVFNQGRASDELPVVEGFDGVIGRAATLEIVEQLGRLRMPIVDVSSVSAPVAGRAKVCNDDRAVGRLAAVDLMDRGLRTLAVYGGYGTGYARLRAEGFASAATAGGATCAVRIEDGPEGCEEARRRWLAQLPRPAGLFAVTDTDGRRIMETCAEVGRLVPEDTAVIGVDNDPLIVGLTLPPLSSVVLPTEAIGYQACVVLERMMSGAAAPEGPVMIPPVRLITRGSSDILAVDDAKVVAALRFIREHATDPIDVPDVVAHVGLSRRTLELRFRLHLGRTPKQEIRRMQIERARVLLAGTLLPMSQVAHRSGFNNQMRFATAFKKETGSTPSAMRNKRG